MKHYCCLGCGEDFSRDEARVTSESTRHNGQVCTLASYLTCPHCHGESMEETFGCERCMTYKSLVSGTDLCDECLTDEERADLEDWKERSRLRITARAREVPDIGAKLKEALEALK